MMQGPYAYLIHLLGWTLPVLLGQFALVVWRHRADTFRILRAILPPVIVIAVYLTTADHFAISAGIWRFPEGKHLGIYLGSVPLEELVFFLVTNLLVALGVVLFRDIQASRA